MTRAQDFAKALSRASMDFFKDQDELGPEDIKAIIEGTGIFLFSSGEAYQKCRQEMLK